MDLARRNNVKLLYDVYRLQIMQGDLARTWRPCSEGRPHPDHRQSRRHEPGTGEINFPWLLQKIDALGYAGWVGCEYKPLARTEDGLAWARDYLGRRG